MLKQFILSLGSNPDAPQSDSKNPFGRGHILHLGYKLMCSGTPDDEGHIPYETKHLVGSITQVPPDGREAGVVPTERADEATFELDPAQAGIDPANPVCQVCGKPLVL